MASKLSQVLVFLAAVTATLQRKLVSYNDVESLNNNRLQNLVAHLKTHTFPSSDAQSYVSKQRSDPSSLLNIQTLNLYVRNNEEKKGQRSEVELDRICKITGRCGREVEREEEREEDRREELEEANEVQQILNAVERELDKDQLRCAERCGGSKRCGCRGSSRSEDKDEENQLRCKYGRCGKKSNKISLKSQLEKYGRKYKINDKLDAIVVDISNVKGLLGKLNGNSKGRPQNQDKEFDMEYLGDVRNVDDDRENDSSDAVFLDLDEANDDEDLVSKVFKDLLYKSQQKTEQDDDPIRPNELADFFEAKKQGVIGNALNFVRNSRGNKDLSVLSKEQRYQLQKVRSEVQRLGARTDLKQVEQKVVDIILGDGLKSEVLPHNDKNNNVYIPHWVYKALKSSREDLRSKRLFPLTIKQKLKMSKTNSNKSNYWRRDLQKDVNVYGVPFQLQVEGLGQINQ